MILPALTNPRCNILSYPPHCTAFCNLLNFLRTGRYYRSGGNVYVRITGGDWWSTTAGSDVYGYALGTHPANTYPQGINSRGYGFAIRCGGRGGVREANTTREEEGAFYGQR